MQIFDAHKVIPVVVLDDEAAALPLAQALMAGGIRIIEITLRTAAGLEAIRVLRQALPDLLVGAGTVVSDEQAVAALAAGAQFGLAPGTDANIVKRFAAAAVPFIPGVMTPSDIQAALALGCTRLKFFPAGAAGGVGMLKSLAAPYKAFGVRFCPTGGVSPANMAEYLALAEVFAVGGTWIATREEIAAADWGAITEKSRRALANG